MSDKKILIAFVLNVCFSIFELIGGIFTNSVAIMSDAVHDFGDAVSIGVSYFLEKISKKKPDNKYTYGYVRYSILGALLTNAILIAGSVMVVISAVKRLINPISVNYDGMIIFALLGMTVNFLAVYFTKGGDSLNQKAVNLHMLEDVFGWVVVFVGAVILKFSKIDRIDALLSMIVSVFIFGNAILGLKEIVDLFLEKTPNNVAIDELRDHLLEIKGISDIHHIHVWSIDGSKNYATMHVVTKEKDIDEVKSLVKRELDGFGINHSTIEIENIKCDEVSCEVHGDEVVGHHHHH